MSFQSLSREEKLQFIKANEFDLIVVGGGIFGACALREAVLRGLKVLLVEAEDFSSGVSANSYKVVHGGIRYLQHLDLPRIWSSCRERSGFLRVAPHLVKPLPILVPTYGWGKLGKPLLGLGMFVYDMLTLGRNKGITDPSRQIPSVQFMNAEQVTREYPGIPRNGLTGGCIFNDGRFYNPTRLVWTFVKTAMHEGGFAVNYVAAHELKMNGDQICGLSVEDKLTGESFDIQCKAILNTAGPWGEHFLANSNRSKYTKPESTYSRDTCFVIKRPPTSSYTVAVQGQTSDPDAVLARPARHLFISPWRDVTLIGVWHGVTKVNPSDINVTREEIQSYLDEINESFPDYHINMSEVSMWNAGLVPFGENEDGQENLSYGKRSLLIDHESFEGVKGLLTLVGIRYTMARDEAERCLSILQKKLGQAVTNPRSDFVKIDGAHFDTFDGLVAEVSAKLKPYGLGADIALSLAHNYGSEYGAIVALMEAEPGSRRVFSQTTVTEAEVRYACRHDMVEGYSDVVFRRTDIATAGNPGNDVLRQVMDVMAEELSWDSARQQKELERVMKRFPDWINYQ